MDIGVYPGHFVIVQAFMPYGEKQVPLYMRIALKGFSYFPKMEKGLGGAILCLRFVAGESVPKIYQLLVVSVVNSIKRFYFSPGKALQQFMLGMTISIRQLCKSVLET